MTKERPILFSTPMVKAILAGNKTMTRRVIKPQPLWFADPSVPFKTIDADPKGIINCPYGKKGDLLWVRETWTLVGGQLLFKTETNSPGSYIWKPSIHIKKDDCRIWIKIKSVKVERLQDISEEDAMKEGIQKFTKDGVGFKYGLDGWNWSCQTGAPFMCNTAKIAFQELWDSINGKPRKDGKDISWGANPWVWAPEFEMTEKPGFMESLGAAIQGKPVNNEFMKANQ